MSVPSVSKPLLWWCAVLTVIILFCVVIYRTGRPCITIINYVRISLLLQLPVPINKGFRWSEWI